MIGQAVTGVFRAQPAISIRADQALVHELNRNVHQTAAVVEQREVLIGYLQRRFAVSPPTLKFLRRNTDLAWVLVGAREAIEASFGPVIIRLDVVKDPEDEGAEERLFGYIRSSLPLDDALLALKRFDEEWFLDNLRITSNRLNFDFEF